MSAVLVGLGVFLAVAAARPRRIGLEPFLAAGPPAPAAPARRVRLPGAVAFGVVAGVVPASALDADAAALAVLGGLGGGLAARAVASTRRRRRARRLDLELPTVADTMALHVLAGEPVSGALHRFAATASGVAGDEIRAALADDTDGLEASLRRAAATTASSDAGRLYDLLAHTHRTGGRLAEALTALAEDYRAARAADITAEGGRRSLSVYGPILALMVPVTLVFLMYPTLAGLNALSSP